MKASDLELNEIATFNEGNIDLYGRRLILHSVHAFGHFRKDIIDMIGLEHSRRIFTRFGYFWGQANASALRRIFKWDSLEELVRAGFRMINLEGLARVEIKQLAFGDDFYMELEWMDSGEAEEHLMETGWAREPVCWKMIGYASGYMSFILNKGIYFIENKCQAKGDTFCTGVGRDIASWGQEIRDQLKYFNTEDIQGMVDRLASRISEKDDELEKKRGQLDVVDRSSGPFFMEYRSKALQLVMQMADRVARFDSSVLITGESGVGKEVLARYIHKQSSRSGGQFVTINCGALPESLLESELFGHKTGSFTGAIRDRIGLFEEATRGTIFLDEIGDISQALQLKLLRVLQEKEILRIGENIPRKVDVRVIAASNKDLDKAVQDGAFRDDLLYRLKVIEINIPPLRERKEDILPMARHITSRLGKRLGLNKLKLDAKCIDFLQSYPWPGNVRELENALERGAVFSDDGIVRPEHLPGRLIRHKHILDTGNDSPDRSLADMERGHIIGVLKRTSWNRTRAARILGISPSTLWRKMKDFELK